RIRNGSADYNSPSYDTPLVPRRHGLASRLPAPVHLARRGAVRVAPAGVGPADRTGLPSQPLAADPIHHGVLLGALVPARADRRVAREAAADPAGTLVVAHLCQRARLSR